MLTKEMTQDFAIVGTNIKPEMFEHLGNIIVITISDFDGGFDKEIEFDDFGKYETRVKSNIGFDKIKCNCCGHLIRHKAIFRNIENDNLIAVGFDCATNISKYKFDIAGAKKQTLRARKLAEKTNAIQTILGANNGLDEALTVSNKIIKNIAKNFYQFGKLSEKQIDLVFKLAEQRKQFEAVSQPVPAVGTKIEDEFQVIWLGSSESSFGYNSTTEIKVGLKHETGYTIFGKIASGSDDENAVRDLALKFDFFEKWTDEKGTIFNSIDKPIKPTSGFYYNSYDLSDMIRELKGNTYKFKFTVKSIDFKDTYKGNAKGTISLIK